MLTLRPPKVATAQAAEARAHAVFVGDLPCKGVCERLSQKQARSDGCKVLSARIDCSKLPALRAGASGRRVRTSPSRMHHKCRSTTSRPRAFSDLATVRLGSSITSTAQRRPHFWRIRNRTTGPTHLAIAIALDSCIRAPGTTWTNFWSIKPYRSPLFQSSSRPKVEAASPGTHRRRLTSPRSIVVISK